MSQAWKKGRGKLGPLAPLLGKWKAAADSPMGPYVCVREYSKFGDGYVRLEAEWVFKAPKGQTPRSYREICLFGPDKDGALSFWSYTSDGKKSSGKLSEATDIHADALCFEAQMDAGLARQIFWPNENGGFNWAVESRTKKGWNRFSLHHYQPA